MMSVSRSGAVSDRYRSHDPNEGTETIFTRFFPLFVSCYRSHDPNEGTETWHPAYAHRHPGELPLPRPERGY